MKSHDEFELTKGFTVGDYKALAAKQDTKAIAQYVRDRFTGRYLRPLRKVPRDYKSGFCMMAISCLMIESLESFRQGWENSKWKSQNAFTAFFEHFEAFAELRGHSEEFYEHVRCGILHQAETTNGWRIRRDPGIPLFDAKTLTIGANAFLKALRTSFADYCKELEEAEWNSDVWKKARIKLDAICENCRTKQTDDTKGKGKRLAARVLASRTSSL